MAVQYKIPDYVHVSQDCRHLLSRIFVATAARVGILLIVNFVGIQFLLYCFTNYYLSQRISIKEIKSHPWFLKNLPRELTDPAQALYYRKENPTFSLQSVEDIMKIVEEAKSPPLASRTVSGFGWGGEEDEEKEEDVEEEEVEEEEDEDEYEKQVKAAHASGEVRLS